MTILFALRGMLLAAVMTSSVAAAPPHRLIVLVNARVPESIELGRYYMKRRNIPREHFLAITVQPNHHTDLNTYERQIREPLSRHFRKHGWFKYDDAGNLIANEVKYLVTVMGVPYMITPSLPAEKMHRYTDRSSLDQELAMLPANGNYHYTGKQPNPFYGSNRGFGAGDSQKMILVTRLDGPALVTVRRMIDDAISVENNGFKGTAYFDLRGLEPGNSYHSGDVWMQQAIRAARRKNIMCIVDQHPDVIPALNAMPDAGLYIGWYSMKVVGPFRNLAFRFNTGAFAYHLYSHSAHKLRDPNGDWCAQLLYTGAAATMGCVHEPYLDGTPQIGIFMERLTAGWNLAEASYAATPDLSWMTVMLGDPLYRPFAKTIEGSALSNVLD